MENLKPPDTLKHNRRSYWAMILVAHGLGALAGAMLVSDSPTPMAWRITMSAAGAVATLHLAHSWWRRHVFNIY